MHKGSITPSLLIITGAFLVVIYGLLFILSLQLDFSNRRTSNERALQVAEAGVEYYRWHLTTDPTDYQDGTGIPGPYQHDLTDEEGNIIGQYSLDITAPVSQLAPIVVRSTGWSTNHPNIKRTVKATFGAIPLTVFAFLHNSNVWFGQDITINGPILTNGGIRMDGTNTSTVSTNKATYTCGLETGCQTPTEKPGIWGNGGPQELWQFPVTGIDFESINIDFSSLKTDAQNNGLYLGPSGEQGYHLVFNPDGTFSVYQVNVAQTIKGYSLEFGCENLTQDIKNQTLLSTENVADNGIIFVEDDAWVDGVVEGKTTVAAARFPVDTNNANIWLTGNITYNQKDGSDSLGMISQNDIVIGLHVPDDMEIDGALLAQKGRVIRHHYKENQCSNGGPDANKNELSIYGSLISNLRSYWNFSGGPGVPASGFVKTTITYDPNLGSDPPDYFPSSGEFKLIDWEEE